MMSSGTHVAKLPVIDFSNPNLKPGSPEWDLVKHQVRRALEEYSCFEASFDQVVELRNTEFGAMEEVFDLSLETKKLYVSDKPFRGYFGHRSKLLESMMIDEAQSAENIEERLTTTLWPQGNISFSKTLVSFTEIASRLEKTIRRMIFEIFGVEKYIDEHIDSTNYLLKLMKYNAHGCISPQRHEHGAPTIWLNGGLPATYHRVVVKGNNARYCVGLFAASKGGFRVKAPEDLVDDKNPVLFKPFDYEEFLGFYLTQVVPGGARTGLTAYCSAMT
ncbi:Detected protein of unknown function [Hibiscus syriacus]|uniref:Non-haem dioxygenase N-terminal domain-containing protein n=1 Tax=Hibiscus syriacus TaxID=106335 RepID=A0A6A2ZW15_HIBSY|nr:Detected protein of unknown function [Hibiscus syriacus]